MLLMNGDKEVLRFSLDDVYLEVIDNEFLPIPLKDYVKTTDYSSPGKIKESIKVFEFFKDYLASRILTMSRENAKAIVHSLGINQSASLDSRVRITIACSGLNMTDNIWIKEESDNRGFQDVCLRNKKLKDAAFLISVLGKDISATGKIMHPDLSTNGTYAKTWYRGENIELWKTDQTSGFVNTKAEVKVSEILDHSNVAHVEYQGFWRDEKYIARCPLIATDEVSLVDGYAMQDWCIHHGLRLLDWLKENCLVEFSRMCVIDYVLANTDRHLGNIQFFVDNQSNCVKGMAPLFDHNQALIADELGNEIDDLVYEVTSRSMYESAKEFRSSAEVELDEEFLPEKCRKRFDKINNKAK